MESMIDFNHVSIPVWCDLEKLTISDSISIDEVSIPVWCDLE